MSKFDSKAVDKLKFNEIYINMIMIIGNTSIITIVMKNQILLK